MSLNLFTILNNKIYKTQYKAIFKMYIKNDHTNNKNTANKKN